MPLTTTQLTVRVMTRAKIIDPSENPTAAESQYVLTIIQSRYEAMKELGTVQFAIDAIPTRYEDAFISVMAVPVASDFGTLTPEIIGLGETGMKAIHALNQRKIDPRENESVDY